MVDPQIARGLRFYQVWLLYRALCFLLGCGVLLALGATLLGFWWLGIPLAVGSLLLFNVGIRCLVRRR